MPKFVNYTSCLRLTENRKILLKQTLNEIMKHLRKCAKKHKINVKLIKCDPESRTFSISLTAPDLLTMIFNWRWDGMYHLDIPHVLLIQSYFPRDEWIMTPSPTLMFTVMYATARLF